MASKSYNDFKRKYEGLFKIKTIPINELEEKLKAIDANDTEKIKEIKKKIKDKEIQRKRITTIFEKIPETTEINAINIWNIICSVPTWKSIDSKKDNFKRFLEIRFSDITDKDEKIAEYNKYWVAINVTNPFIIPTPPPIIETFTPIAPPRKSLKKKMPEIEAPPPRPEIFLELETKKVKTSTYEKKDLSTDLYKQFLRNLYTDYYSTLRGDFYNVKLQDYDEKVDNYYKDGIIYFNKLLKKNNSREFKLNPLDAQFLDLYAKFNKKLYSGNTSSAFSKMVGRIEGKGVNYYRHLSIQRYADNNNLDRETLQNLFNKADANNTSVRMFVSNYLNNE